MIDEYVNKGTVAAAAIWAGVVGLMLVAWGLLIASDADGMTWKYAGMMAATACALSAFAAVVHMRCYMVRVACLVRAGAGVREDERPRPVRGL